jgi:phytoene synthase
VSTIAPDVRAAYLRCEEITRREARNFSYGIRLLPPPKRDAMSAIYALARRIDDIGDRAGPGPAKQIALSDLRHQIETLATAVTPPTEDPVLVALGDAVRRFPVPLDAFGDLIDGCERDVVGAHYETIDDLVAYCRLVAGSIGRLSLGVFGVDDPGVGMVLADDLGVALQLTNILRDVREDAGMGRVYLPSDDLVRFGVEPATILSAEGVTALIRFEADQARMWFERGLQLLPLLDRRSRACVATMAGIYRRLLTRIDAAPEAVLEGRMSLPRWEKAWVALRSLVGAGA